MWNSPNPFLNGPFAPWRQEGYAHDLEIEGELPSELNGTLYRATGAAQYEPIDTNSYHLFDGEGMIHAFTLADGRASYRNRYVATPSLLAARKHGRAIYGSLTNGYSTPIPNDAPQRHELLNTNVAVFAEKLIVFSEETHPYELDRRDMSTIGPFTFGIDGPVTAHWKVDPNNGDLLFYSIVDTSLTWYRADSTGKVVETYAFILDKPHWLHDFAVTERYAIWFLNPAMGHFSNIDKHEPYITWEEGAGSKVALMDRTTGEMRILDAGGDYLATHILNAYDDGNTVIVDGCRINRFATSVHEAFELGRPWRWTIDLDSGNAEAAPTGTLYAEGPRINDAYTGRKHRYGYFIGCPPPMGQWMHNLAKHDFETGETQFQDFRGELLAPIEPVFAPRPGGTAEDDGWILSVWWDPKTDRSELVVIEAQNFAGPPVARVKLNHRVQFGFHGNWTPAF